MHKNYLAYKKATTMNINLKEFITPILFSTSTEVAPQRPNAANANYLIKIERATTIDTSLGYVQHLPGLEAQAVGNLIAKREQSPVAYPETSSAANTPTIVPETPQAVAEAVVPPAEAAIVMDPDKQLREEAARQNLKTVINQPYEFDEAA
jgi:hypothetical protein